MEEHIINLKTLFHDMGIEVRFVDPSDPQNFADATDDKTQSLLW